MSNSQRLTAVHGHLRRLRCRLRSNTLILKQHPQMVCWKCNDGSGHRNKGITAFLLATVSGSIRASGTRWPSNARSNIVSLHRIQLSAKLKAASMMASLHRSYRSTHVQRHRLQQRCTRTEARQKVKLRCTALAEGVSDTIRQDLDQFITWACANGEASILSLSARP